MENLGTVVLAVGALGTAAFGIVEALKWTWVGMLGFSQIEDRLGAPFMQALRLAYGPDYLELLKGQYRNGRTASELRKFLRQGVRVGLNESTAVPLAEFLGVVDAARLQQVAAELQTGEPLDDDMRGLLGRFELALDARIDAALAFANDRYIGLVRMHASGFALAIALLIGWLQGVDLKIALVIGIAAVPVAPLAKDLTTAIQAASQAFRGGS